VSNETCIVCGREFVSGTRFDLTAEEKAQIGPDAPDHVDYCAPCLRIAQNLQQGAHLLTGLYERGLKAQGIRNTTELAKEFHKQLLQKATRKMQ
jgi:hypothetical protein